MSSRIVLTVVFSILPYTAAAAEVYPVRVTVPATVGDRARSSYIATENNKSVMTFDERETKNDAERKVEMDMVEEVKKVGPTSQPTEVLVRIERCEEIVKDGAHRTILEPGRSITVTAGKTEARLRLDHGKLDPKDEALLRLVIRLHEEDGPTDEELFGTNEKQPIGGSWPVNADMFAKRPMHADYDPIKPNQVKGTVTLVGVQDVPDFGKCLQLELNFTIENMTGKNGSYKLDDGDFQSITEMLIPLKGSDAPSESSASKYHQVFTSTYGGRPVRVESDSNRTVEVHRKLLPPATQPATVPSTRPTPKPLATKPTTKSNPTTQVR